MLLHRYRTLVIIVSLPNGATNCPDRSHPVQISRGSNIRIDQSPESASEKARSKKVSSEVRVAYVV